MSTNQQPANQSNQESLKEETELELLMEAEYWNRRAEEEADYLAHLAILAEREE